MNGLDQVVRASYWGIALIAWAFLWWWEHGRLR